ncbi:hypothetical protein HOLleu_24409 [Holothuria leucospilota]|uniref:Uncharacterized protein n=1 Tax=Holothuria leucospilota TaxID=206669 RepID=A0A9Q1H5W8_HOLLE|nr:hypothetical protein HOLleu_24409 [Holothuria leucospilota]
MRSFRSQQHRSFLRKFKKINSLIRQSPLLSRLTRVRRSLGLGPDPTRLHFAHPHSDAGHQQIPHPPATAETAPSGVINVSNTELTTKQLSVLKRGLSFCPSTPIDKVELSNNVIELSRKVRLREWANNNIPAPERIIPQHVNTLKKKWTPPSKRNAFIDAFVSSVNSHLDSFLKSMEQKPQTETDNLSRSERNALASFKVNSNIIIKPADKGGAVVVMDRSGYISEAESQLSDTRFYTKLPDDPTPIYYKEIDKPDSKLLTVMLKHEVMPLIPMAPKPAIFYTLPKSTN